MAVLKYSTCETSHLLIGERLARQNSPRDTQRSDAALNSVRLEVGSRVIEAENEQEIRYRARLIIEDVQLFLI